MIFRRTLRVEASEGPIRPAFECIQGIQQQATAGDWYVSQTDHGRVAGHIAAAFDSRPVPDVRDNVIKAIAMHDVGWMPFDGELGAPRQPELLADGRPMTFLDAPPQTFLAAWQGSIQAAQSTGPLGGLLVSAHTARLAQPWLASGAGTAEQRAAVMDFVYREANRVERLLPDVKLQLEEVAALLKALQFCDILSLYICANPRSGAEFPQEFDGNRITLTYEDGSYRMRPNLMDHVVILEIPCVRWVDGRAEKELLPIKLQ